MRETLSSPEENVIHHDVVIAGAGLSGLVLSRELEKRGVDYVVADSAPRSKGPVVHYLLSRAASENLGLSEYYNHRLLRGSAVTGYRRLNYDAHGLEPLEQVVPNSMRDGFVVVSIQELKEIWASQLNIRFADPIVALELNERNLWKVDMRSRTKFTSKCVIDATGQDAHLGKLIGRDAAKPQRQCYGGVFEYGGPINELLFLDRMQNVGNRPPETAGWIMPVGDGTAEIIIAHELDGGMSGWRDPQLRSTLADYIEWFNKRGIQIGERISTISGNFAQGLPKYSSVLTTDGFSLFGEALGLNHPLNGYLIHEIQDHAVNMADEIIRFLATGRWDPHRAMVGKSPVKYGLEKSLGNIKTRSAQAGEGRSKPLAPLHKALSSALGEDGLWRAIDHGVEANLILLEASRNPNLAGFLVRLASEYLRLLVDHSQYRDEIFDKVRYSLRRS